MEHTLNAWRRIVESRMVKCRQAEATRILGLIDSTWCLGFIMRMSSLPFFSMTFQYQIDVTPLGSICHGSTLRVRASCVINFAVASSLVNQVSYQQRAFDVVLRYLPSLSRYLFPTISRWPSEIKSRRNLGEKKRFWIFMGSLARSKFIYRWFFMTTRDPKRVRNNGWMVGPKAKLVKSLLKVIVFPFNSATREERESTRSVSAKQRVEAFTVFITHSQTDTCSPFVFDASSLLFWIEIQMS